MERIEYINIERTDAYLDHNISFVDDLYNGARNFVSLRRNNLKTTDIIWITCRLRVWHNELYNSKTPILIFLN